MLNYVPPSGSLRMPFRLANLRRHSWLASLVLLAFMVRALIPAGFMPTGEGGFGLQICPDGFPAELLAGTGDPTAHAGHHHHPSGDSSGSHDHKSWASSHCAFAAVASAPPLWHPAVVAIPRETPHVLALNDSSRAPQSYRYRIAQPRAPPVLA